MPGGPPNFPIPTDSTTSFLARLIGQDKSWIAAATVNPGQGMLQATFWKKLGEKVEAGVGLEMKAASGAAPAGAGMMVAGPGGRVREGNATFGLKYQFRTAMLKAQIDSGGRVTALLERNLSQQISIAFCGDIDHFKVRPLPQIPVVGFAVVVRLLTLG
jgi:mitochondrial import receptor subunit TOM40